MVSGPCAHSTSIRKGNCCPGRDAYPHGPRGAARGDRLPKHQHSTGEQKRSRQTIDTWRQHVSLSRTLLLLVLFFIRALFHTPAHKSNRRTVVSLRLLAPSPALIITAVIKNAIQGLALRLQLDLSEPFGVKLAVGPVLALNNDIAASASAAAANARQARCCTGTRRVYLFVVVVEAKPHRGRIVAVHAPRWPRHGMRDFLWREPICNPKGRIKKSK